jgi:hypothetical protein
MAKKPRKTLKGGQISHLPPGNTLPLAEGYLCQIREYARQIAAVEAEHREEADALALRYDARLRNLREARERNHDQIMRLMKSARTFLFDGIDVVDLPSGSLIRTLADHVTIPRDAIEKCEALGLTEAIKIAKSLDREAVEKWPDERLFLIGAERKPEEKFSYDVKPRKEPDNE